MQIVHMQPLVSSLSASDRLVQPLRKDSISVSDGYIFHFLGSCVVAVNSYSSLVLTA